MPKFSVLMSVYLGDEADYLYEAIQSVLNQSKMPDEIILVEDGPLKKETKQIINKYKKQYPHLFKVHVIQQNVGLGRALNVGLGLCTHNLVARMDSDDIALPNRFALQLDAFIHNPKLVVVGGQIEEFSENPKNITGKRIVPLANDDIRSYQKLRTSMNHMTVMFKKKTVLDSGGYDHSLYMEDSILWAKLQSLGHSFENLPVILVYVRGGKEQLKRRAGYSYFVNQRYGRRLMLSRGYIGLKDYYFGLSLQFLNAMLPNGIRRTVYKHVLRKSA